MIKLIAAVSKNDVIGSNGGIPWKISADLKRFKALTLYNAVIMGRKTYDSIGKPLPDRMNYVVSQTPIENEKVHVCSSVEEAVKQAEATDCIDVFGIGGTKIYQALLPKATHLHLTIVNKNFFGDTWFPLFHLESWDTIAVTKPEAVKESEPPYLFVELERVANDPEGSPSLSSFPTWVDSLFNLHV